MRRPITSTTFVLALLTLVGGASQPAEAGGWYIGGGFRVGGLHFSLAFDRDHRHRDPYYYRTQHRVNYEGYACGSYCLKKSGYSYHHASCPLVLHHFRVHRYNPAWAWSHYRGPRYDRFYDRGHDYGHRDYGYRDYGRRDRGHRDYGRRDYRYRHRDHDPRYCPYR